MTAGPAAEAAGHHVVEVLALSYYGPFGHQVGQLEAETQVRPCRPEPSPYGHAERDDLRRPVLLPGTRHLQTVQRPDLVGRDERDEIGLGHGPRLVLPGAGV